MDRRHRSPILDSALRALEEAPGAAVLVFDQNLEVLTADEEAEALFQLPIGRMIGLPLAELLPELGRKSSRRTLQAVLEQGTRRSLGRLMPPIWPASQEEQEQPTSLLVQAVPCSAGTWRGGAIALQPCRESRSLAREPDFSWSEAAARSSNEFPAWEEQCGAVAPLVGSTTFERSLRAAARSWRSHGEDTALLALAPDALATCQGREGEELLQRLVRKLEPHLPGDAVVCLRGNTFLVMLPSGSRVEEALAIGKRFAASLRCAPGGPSERVTFGAGIASFSQLASPHPPGARDLEEFACRALVDARQAGSAQVMIHGRLPQPLAA